MAPLAILGGISLAKPMTLVQLPNPKRYPPRFVNLFCMSRRCFAARTRGPPDADKGHGQRINSSSSVEITSVEITSNVEEEGDAAESETRGPSGVTKGHGDKINSSSSVEITSVEIRCSKVEEEEDKVGTSSSDGGVIEVTETTCKEEVETVAVSTDHHATAEKK